MEETDTNTMPLSLITQPIPAPIVKRKSNNPDGRTRIYDGSDLSLQKARKLIDEWVKKPIEDITICGLAIHLGFNSRSTLLEYLDRGDVMSAIIKRGYIKVEEKYERKLCSQQYGGAIFALKNMKWRDIQETTNGVQINIVPK